MLQHVWTYKPLVHDVLGMHANSVTIEAKAEPGQMPGTTSTKRYEVCPVSMLSTSKNPIKSSAYREKGFAKHKHHLASYYCVQT